MNGSSSRRGRAGVHDDDGGSSPCFASSPQLTEDTGGTLAEPSSRGKQEQQRARQLWRFPWLPVRLVRNIPIGAWLVISGGGWSPMTQSGLDAEADESSILCKCKLCVQR